ncbi:MAG: hypothetical protein LBE49_01500 [Deltaproteobacteria bacterium]|nr:hypothetical protein [Deltaproteobacteria bacterium]
MRVLSAVRKIVNFVLAKPGAPEKLPPLSIRPPVSRRPQRRVIEAPLAEPASGLAPLASPVREIRRRLRSCRSLEPAPINHQEALKIWDLKDEAAISRAMREGRLRIWIFIGSGLIASASLLASGRPLLALAPLFPAAAGAATALWRLSILRERSWRPFPGWLREKAGRLFHPWSEPPRGR